MQMQRGSPKVSAVSLEDVRKGTGGAKLIWLVVDAKDIFILDLSLDVAIKQMKWLKNYLYRQLQIIAISL